MANLFDGVLDSTVTGLQRSLDLNKKRSEAIYSNVANAETPGYQAVDVNFAGELEKAFKQQQNSLMKTDPRHMDLGSNSSESHLVGDYTGAMRADGNNVDIDLQMAKMARVSGQYGLGTSLLRRKMQILVNALRQSRL